MESRMLLKHIKLLYHTYVLRYLLLQNSQDGQPSGTGANIL